MAIPHAQPGEVIDVRPLATSLASSKTKTIIKTPHVEVIRMVLPAGKIISEHKARGEIIVQCLEGDICLRRWANQRDFGQETCSIWRRVSRTLLKHPKILPSCSRLSPRRTKG